MDASIKKKLIMVTSVVAAIFVIAAAGNLFETNQQGNYQVKQAFLTGEMSVHSDPGTYWQGFGVVDTYQMTDDYYFFTADKKDQVEPVAHVDNSAIEVTFNNESRGWVSGQLKFRLPADQKNQLKIDREFHSNEGVKRLIQTYITEVLTQTAPLMSAEEAYSTRRSEFNEIAERQLRQGIYHKTTKRIQVQGEHAGEESFDESSTKRVVELTLDKDGQPIITKTSPLRDFGIEVINFTVLKTKFDQRTEELIAEKKETEMKQVLSEADTRKAQQDAIKAEAEGRARVAIAEAEALVLKKTAVIEAQRQYEVAQYDRKKAEEQAKAELVRREADAKANKLLVMAGLTPRERAEFDMKTAIGVAEQLSKVQLPQLMTFGGGNQGPTDPFQAVGLESLMKISKGLVEGK